MVDQELLDAIGGMLEPLIKEQRDMRRDMQEMRDDIDALRQDQREMHGDIDVLRRDQRVMRDDLQALKADVALIPDMRRDIDLILESQQGINEKFADLDLVNEDVGGLNIRVSALEGASRSHTEEIRELRLAK